MLRVAQGARHGVEQRVYRVRLVEKASLTGGETAARVFLNHRDRHPLLVGPAQVASERMERAPVEPSEQWKPAHCSALAGDQMATRRRL